MILRAEVRQAKAIALLHRQTLTSSFLAKLGIGFLEALYTFLIKKEVVITYTEKGVLKGFVSSSANSSGMMKRFLYSCPVCIFRLLRKLISSPQLFQRFIETFTAPFKSKTSLTAGSKVILPAAELLSISVDPACQATGIGSQLVKALEEQLLQKGISSYKVIAGVSLESANAFYKRNGFTLVSQVIIHGNELSNIYIKEI
ncbi:MAG: GNAT family N-acetyltransferase [Bacteroidales bacterium]